MITPPDNDLDSLPLVAEVLVDEVCLRFEAAWQTGQRPRLQDFLADFAGTERLVLLRELILLDACYRRGVNEQACAEDYLQCSPNLDATWVAGVIEAASTPQERRADAHTNLGAVSLEDYDQLELLGRGGMGVVYRARQIRLNRTVALKMIRAGDLASAADLERFRTEAEVVARLRHPNIVQIYEVGEHQGRPFLALEFVEGGNLHSKLQGAPLPPRAAARLTELLAHGMQAAHERGILHRDLKPANVFLLPARQHDSVSLAETDGSATQYVPKIGDFGLAKQLGEGAGLPVSSAATLGALTQSGAIVGTPNYMAPEQAQGNPSATGPAVDIYALGALLYELLTGRPPFKAATPLETLFQVMTNEPVAVRRLQPQTPRDLETVCLKCLHKNPAKRYGSAALLAEDLRRYLAAEPILARPVGQLERGWSWCRRNPAVATTATVALTSLLVTTVLAVLFAWHSSAAADREAANVQSLRSAQANTKAALHQSRGQSARFALEKGQQLAVQGKGDGVPDAVAGMLWMARALELAPEDDLELQRAIRLNLTLWSRELLLPRGTLPLRVAHAVTPAQKSFFVTCSGPLGNIWNLKTGQAVGKPLKQAYNIQTLACSDDGTRILTADKDGEACVWQMPTGEPTGLVFRHPVAIVSAALSPNGKAAVTLGKDNTLRLWDLTTGQLQNQTDQQTLPLVKVIWSPNGQWLLTHTDHRVPQLQLWNATTLQPVGPPRKSPDWVDAIAFSPDSKTIGVGNAWWIDFLKTDSGKMLRRIPQPDVTLSLAYSPDGQTVFAGCLDLKARLLNVKTGRLVGNPLGHFSQRSKVLCLPDNQHVLTLSAGQASLWQKPSGQRVRLFPRPPSENPWPPNATGSFGFDEMRLSVNGTGSAFVTANKTHQVRLQSASSGQPFGPCFAHEGPILAVALSQDGRLLLTGGADNKARLWKVATGELVCPPLVHQTRVVAVVISPDGKTLLTGTLCSSDRKVPGQCQAWDAATGQPLPVRRSGDTWAVSFSPDGKRFATGQWPHANVWDTATGKRHAGPFLHPRAVNCLVFRADAEQLYTVSNRLAQTWDLQRGTTVGEAMPHAGWVESIAVSPDGRLLATAAGEGIRLWDAATQKQLGPILRLPDPNWGTFPALQFAEGGRTLLVCGAKQDVLRWELPEAVTGSVACVVCWTELLTSATLEKDGNLRYLDGKERNQRRRQLRQLGGLANEEPPEELCQPAEFLGP